MRFIWSTSEPPETVSEPVGLAVAPPNVCVPCSAFAMSCIVGGILWSACKSAV